MQETLNQYCYQMMADPLFPIEVLEQFLTELDFTAVDFNTPLGDRTPFIIFMQFACSSNQVSPLKIILEKADFRTLDFSRNLPCLFNFAAYYTPVRSILRMILEKIDSEQLGEVLKQIHALLFTPMLILGLEGRGKIFKTLLSKDKKNALGLNETLKEILLELKEEAIEEALADAFGTGKIVVKADAFLLACCWNGAVRAAVTFIRKTNQVLDYDMLRLIKQQEGGFSYPVVGAILPFYSLFDIPLYHILSDQSFFKTIEGVNDFLDAEATDEVLDFLERRKLASPVTLAALRLREMAEEVKEDLAHILGDKEAVVGGNQVMRANRHFDEKVEPYFRKQFLAYSPTQEVMACVENIEKEIRIMILKAILERSKKEKNKEISQFVEEHFNALSEGNAEAMKASCALLSSTCVEHAAWRAYNPYALVKNRKDHPNLLACHDLLEEERNQSNQIRKKVAYYYLATIGAETVDRETSLMHYIGKIADMRNSNGQNDPACFPGASTHIGAMGAFHPVAKLPPTIEDILPDFFCTKVLAALAKCDEPDREKLLHALCDLSEETSMAIICKKSEYPEDLLSLRERFIAFLGSPASLLEEMVAAYQGENIGFYLNDMDEKLVAQHLMDITRGKVRLALEMQFIKLTDKPPTAENIKALSQGNALVYVLCRYFVEHLPAYRASLHAVKGLVAFLNTQHLRVLPENKMQRLLSKQIFPSLIGIEDYPIHVGDLLSVLKQEKLVIDTVSTPIIFNTFKRKREAIEKSLKRQKQSEGFFKVLQNSAHSLKEKEDLFKHCRPWVVFYLWPQLSSKMDASLLERFLNAMVEDMANSEDKRFNLERFCKNELNANALSGFSEEEKQFLLSSGLLELIAEKVNSRSSKKKAVI